MADLLANLIEKYADTLDLEHLPEPPHELINAKKNKELHKCDELPIERAKAV